jgi:hypothetical protein
VRGPAAGDAVDPPARTDRVAVAGLEVAPADVPAVAAQLSSMLMGGGCGAIGVGVVGVMGIIEP